jgi:hypothetical protein
MRRLDHSQQYYLKRFESEITIWVDTLLMMSQLVKIGRVIMLDAKNHIIIMRVKEGMVPLVVNHEGIMLISKVILHDE